MKKRTFAETSAEMREQWNVLEKLTGSTLVFHDYSGIVKETYENNLLDGINIHRSECCQFPPHNQQRCQSHCALFAKLRAAEEGKAFTMTCWRGVKELVVPLFLQDHLAAVLFAGAFRDETFDVSPFSRKYQKLYKALPLWDEKRRKELESLLTLAGFAMLQEGADFRNSPDGGAEREKMIIDFFRYRYAEDVGAGDLAAALGLSESRTLHLLHKYFKKGFSRLLNEERLLHVKEYLGQSDLPLREIAQMTGFRNEYYLNAVFKKYCGITPGGFRRRFRR